jgi:hypothetical protein
MKVSVSVIIDGVFTEKPPILLELGNEGRGDGPRDEGIIDHLGPGPPSKKADRRALALTHAPRDPRSIKGQDQIEMKPCFKALPDREFGRAF